MSLTPVIINSPPGSGGIFARELIRNNLKAEVIWPLHQLDGFKEDSINICIIRNPYECLASGLEAGFRDKDSRTQEELDWYDRDPYNATLTVLPFTLKIYNDFLDACENLEYVTAISFEFLTENPEKFLKYISEKFKIDFRPEQERVSAEDTKLMIASNESHGTRVPRETTEMRKIMDPVVSEYSEVKDAYDRHLILKNTIQLTENML
jgi:hypothetical protein